MEELPAKAQVVVIGGGFAGATTAYNLALAGMSDVIVLEREATYGFHASGRNAAMCRQLTEDGAVSDLTVRGAAFLREPPAEFTETPLLRSTGSILLSSSEAGLDQLCGAADSRSIPHKRLSLDEILTRVSRLSGVPAAGGVEFPTDGVIDIHALLSGFLAGARVGGARVVLNAEVKRFKQRRQLAVIETEQGVIETPCVVNAAGAWAGELGRKCGSADTAFTPYHRHLFITERVPNLEPNDPIVWHLDHHFYLRPEGESYLISGCDETAMDPCDARVGPDATPQLAEKLGKLIPWIADLGIARSWACLRTFTPDRRPVVGWDRQVPWLFWVAGLGGHGATASPAIGRIAAKSILDRLGTL